MLTYDTPKIAVSNYAAQVKGQPLKLKRSVFEWIPFSNGRNSSPHCICIQNTN